MSEPSRDTERSEMLSDSAQAEIEIAEHHDRMLRSLFFWAAVTIISVAAIIVGGYHFTNRVAMEKGLCQGAIPGSTGWHWVACPPK